jgi:hypothetical protein
MNSDLSSSGFYIQQTDEADPSAKRITTQLPPSPVDTPLVRSAPFCSQTAFSTVRRMSKCCAETSACCLFNDATSNSTLILWNVLMLKSKVLHLHAMMAYSGSKGIDPLILNLGTRPVWVVSFTFRPIYLKGSYPVGGCEDHGHWMDVSA